MIIIKDKNRLLDKRNYYSLELPAIFNAAVAQDEKTILFIRDWIKKEYPEFLLSFEKKFFRNYSAIGVLGYFNPLNIDDKELLKFACEQAERVIIGVCSNSKNDRYTIKEKRNMIFTLLSDNYSNFAVQNIPNFNNDDKKWKTNLYNVFGKLDGIITIDNQLENKCNDIYSIIKEIN